MKRLNGKGSSRKTPRASQKVPSIPDILKSWATAREQQDQERERQIRKARKADVARRIITRSRRWQKRPGVAWNYDLALRLGALAKLAKAMGKKKIELPHGMIAAHAQTMLRQASIGRVGWRRRIAKRLENLYDAAVGAGLLNIPVEDPRAWESPTIPQRDSMMYFRDSRSPNLFEDMETILGLRTAPVDESLPANKFDELESVIPPWRFGELQPVSGASFDEAAMKSLAACSAEFARATHERDSEQLIRLCRFAAERAGRCFASELTEWSKFWTSDAGFKYAWHTVRSVFEVLQSIPPMSGKQVISTMHAFTEVCEADAWKFQVQSDVESHFWRHHFLEILARHARVLAPAWRIESKESKSWLISDTVLGPPSALRDFYFRYAREAEEFITRLLQTAESIGGPEARRTKASENRNTNRAEDGDRPVTDSSFPKYANSGKVANERIHHPLQESLCIDPRSGRLSDVVLDLLFNSEHFRIDGQWLIDHEICRSGSTDNAIRAVKAAIFRDFPDAKPWIKTTKAKRGQPARIELKGSN